MEVSQSGNAAVAAATACSSSAVPSSGTRRFTSPGFDQKADPVVLIDLNQLLRETADAHKADGDSGLDWVLNLNPIPMIRGSASQIRSLLGYLIQQPLNRAVRRKHGV